MGEARRRKGATDRDRRNRAAGYATQPEVVRDFLDQTVLRNAPVTPMIGIGPLVWGINPNDGRHWYCVFASADADGRFHLDCLKLANDDREAAEQIRMVAMLDLMSRDNPIVLNDFDDEVRFAAFCAAAWPSERTRKLHADIKADYASRNPAEENF